MTVNPLSVYRLLPGLGDFRTLLFGSSLTELIRWQINGSAGEPPDAVTAEWDGDPRLRESEFPSGYPGAPVLSRRLAEALGEELLEAGRLIPVEIAGAGGQGEYFLYVVEAVVDCVDPRRSAKPKKTTGQMKITVFRPDAVPAALPAFRVPEFPGGVHWNGWAVDRLRQILGTDLETRLIWSEDRSATP
ncbi:hypothetical protein, partial [Streptomyces sp. TRM68416]|uniref:hypothetical protein n=1 Tax=Streptomyces sp. TRM68416 TaxID=2758412 RepID=UPI001661B357